MLTIRQHHQQRVSMLNVKERRAISLQLLLTGVGNGAGALAPKNSGKHFSGKSHVKFGHFVIFCGGGAFGHISCKIREFCQFFGQISCKIREFR